MSPRARYGGRSLSPLLLLYSCVVLLVCAGRVSCWERLYTNSWVVEIEGGDEEANVVASRHGFVNLGQVGRLEGTYHFLHSSSPARSRRALTAKHLSLMADKQVLYTEQQVAKKRVKRDYEPPPDDMWSQQWYLHRSTHHDMNVERAWEQGVSGRGVVVSILDDGIEHTHPDLKDNYDAMASYDFNSRDSDPFPRYDVTNENKHGTRCAGEVSANRDGQCGTGAAYHANIGGVRMLDGQVTDVVESSSLYLNPQHIDIYSSSWGPSDNGQTVDGPGRLAKQAFIDGVTIGRHGKGSIFVWAAGNGGRDGDSCNCDGYAVSPYTISIGSVSQNDRFPWYAELCSSTLTSTYSSGSGSEKQIVSTDLHHKCTDRHTGTSASAPLGAGLLALALETNSNLTWRDMQYIVVYSSNPELPTDGDWTVNGVGLKASHKYGFGVLDGAAIVNRARWWVTVPPRENCSLEVDVNSNRLITDSQQLDVKIDTTLCSLSYLEHAQAIMTLELSKGKRKDIEILIKSAMGTRSILLPYRKRDYHSDGFHSWPFMSVHSWGEDPRGEWTVTVKVASSSTSASLQKLILVLYGTEEMPRSVRNVPEQCDRECVGGCAGEGPQYCDTCRNFQLASTFECVSVCPIGTYKDHHMCRTCPSLCAHCSKGSCLSCVDGAVMSSDGVCGDSCDPFTYLSPNGSCLSCHHSCVECVGPEENSCISCPEQFILDSGSCQVPSSCQSGEFFDGRSLECRICHESCAECVGKGADECTACFPGFDLEESACVVEESNPTKCSTGSYYNTENQICYSCPNGCEKCTDNITCTSCDPHHFLRRERIGDSQVEVRLCVLECPNGFHGDEETLSCQPCPSDCASCSSHDTCTSCTLNYTSPVNGLCPQPCHDAEYFDFTTSHCLHCFPNCKSCRNSATCTACIDNFYLLGDTLCTDTCPEHLIVDTQKGRCISESCDPSCESCIGPEPDQCIACPGDSKLFEGSCIDDCPTHTYYDDPSSSCRHCHNNCRTCAGPGQDNCLQCPENRILSHFSCVSKCPENSYANNNECVSCPLPCSKCVSSTECSVCKQSFLLQEDKCVKKCSEGFYPSPSSSSSSSSSSASCFPCPPGCQTCSSPSLCIKCRTNFLFYTPNHSCLRSCPDGYYPNQGSCSPCNPLCSVCTGPKSSQCTLCSFGWALNETSRLCVSCCNKDVQIQEACCDCDQNNKMCVQASKSSVQNGNHVVAHPFGLALIIIILTMFAAVTLSIGIYYWWTRVRPRNSSHSYKPLRSNHTNGELNATLALVQDTSDSGSEAELYAKDEP